MRKLSKAQQFIVDEMKNNPNLYVEKPSRFEHLQCLTDGIPFDGKGNKPYRKYFYLSTLKILISKGVLYDTGINGRLKLKI